MFARAQATIVRFVARSVIAWSHLPSLELPSHILSVEGSECIPKSGSPDNRKWNRFLIAITASSVQPPDVQSTRSKYLGQPLAPAADPIWRESNTTATSALDIVSKAVSVEEM
jgi:hypothetical protein